MLIKHHRINVLMWHCQGVERCQASVLRGDSNVVSVEVFKRGQASVLREDNNQEVLMWYLSRCLKNAPLQCFEENQKSGKSYQSWDFLTQKNHKSFSEKPGGCF